MRRAKEKKNVEVKILSDNHITFNFNSTPKISIIVFRAIMIVLIATLLAMPFSDTDTLMQWISSFLSALGC
ncbi:MAG: hypothetical protein DBX47_05795 [Clostridiales bacterium]|nr:MAG: hypothetical protein DBX47_05795 [Clostridiales bacterium]